MPQGISTTRVVALEHNLCAKLTADDHRIAGGFLHFCDDWDGLLIDQTDPEFEACSCSFSEEFDPKTGMITAQAIEAQRAETPQSGSVEDESAVAKPCAQKRSA